MVLCACRQCGQCLVCPLSTEPGAGSWVWAGAGAAEGWPVHHCLPCRALWAGVSCWGSHCWRYCGQQVASECFHSEAEEAYTEAFGCKLVSQKVQEDLHKRGDCKAHWVYFFTLFFFFEHLIFWAGSTKIWSFDLTTLSHLRLTWTTDFKKASLSLWNEINVQCLCFVCHGLLHQSFCSQISLGDEFSISMYIKDLKQCIGLVVSKGHEIKHRNLEVSRR